MVTCSSHRRRPPVPVRNPEDALRALGVATGNGSEAGVVLACLDRERLPLTMFIVEGGDDIVLALDVLIEADRDRSSPLHAVVLATSRPGHAEAPGADEVGVWALLERRCAHAGIELLDWFVLSDGAAWSVGAHAGSSSRW